MPPAADIAVDEDLVRALLQQQHPDLAGLPLRPVATGWDNVVLRLGRDLAVRLPRRTVAAALLRHEQLVLPVLAARLPVKVPVPVRLGLPSDRFPFHWSVVPWFAGGTVAAADLREDDGLADALSGFVAALHRPAPADAPVNAVRGGALAGRAQPVAERLATGLVPDAGRAAQVWSAALAAAPFTGAPVWLHGDLHPANMIESDGALAAVIDFGDVTAGDPATDLATAWLSLGPAARERFRAAAAPDPATWARARGWALCMAAAMLTGSDPGSLQHRVGALAMREVLGPA